MQDDLDMSAVAGQKAPNVKLNAVRDGTDINPEIKAYNVQYPAEGNDTAHMQRLGKKQELTRNFQFLSITAFSVVALSGWTLAPNNATWQLVDGNTGGAITLFLMNFVLFFFVMLSIAEMASLAPTAGGQYHWASEFAPPSMQKLLSYTAGWLSALAWCAGVTSGFFVAGTMIQGVAVLAHPSYHPEPYQAYLMVIALTGLGILVNTVLARYLPKLEGFVLIWTLLTFTAIISSLWILSPRLPAKEVFGTFSNDGGWSSLGLAMMAAQGNLVWPLTGADATVHMAEETRNASAVIPKALLTCYVMNGLLTLVMLITYCFCLVDLDSALGSATGFPFMQVFVTATGSTSAAATLSCLIIVTVLFGTFNFLAASSRQVFAFARDGGLPYSRFISTVRPKTGLPVNSVYVAGLFIVLMSLIALGSTVAFNAIISVQLLSLVFTYMITIGCLLWRRRWGKPLPRGSWSLGRWGGPVNVVSVVYCLYLMVFVPFPVTTPPTLATVNWAVVMFTGVMAISLLFYLFYARKAYAGPVAFIRSMSII